MYDGQFAFESVWIRAESLSSVLLRGSSILRSDCNGNGAVGANCSWILQICRFFQTDCCNWLWLLRTMLMLRDMREWIAHRRFVYGIGSWQQTVHSLHSKGMIMVLAVVKIACAYWVCSSLQDWVPFLILLPSLHSRPQSQVQQVDIHGHTANNQSLNLLFSTSWRSHGIHCCFYWWLPAVHQHVQ